MYDATGIGEGLLAPRSPDGTGRRHRVRRAVTPGPRRRDGWFWLLAGLALLGAVNAASMLLSPQRWYHEAPAAVPDFGPYNEHFVRDVGCAFLTVAVALGWAALRPAWRLPLVGTAAVFLVAHAVLHAYDTLRGYVAADHWWIDVPGVYAPAVLLVVLVRRLTRRPQQQPGETPG